METPVGVSDTARLETLECGCSQHSVGVCNTPRFYLGRTWGCETLDGCVQHSRVGVPHSRRSHTDLRPEDKGPYAHTPNTVDLIPILYTLLLRQEIEVLQVIQEGGRVLLLEKDPLQVI